MEQYEKLKAQLLDQIEQVTNTSNIPQEIAAQLIPVCIDALNQLKELVKNNVFKSLKDEIYFFKILKPEVYAKLIFYHQLYNLELSKPAETEKQLKKYYIAFLKTINKFREENSYFYKYYRSGSVYLDEKYFIRNKSNFLLYLNNSVCNYDATFNTSHDFSVAQILAYDQLIDHVHKELDKIEKNLFAGVSANVQSANQLKWTGKKNSLVELIYALHASGEINDGNADVKEIARFFETNLKVELGDLYRNFYEIKYRKTNRTKFIDTLKDKLINRMDEINGF